MKNLGTKQLETERLILRKIKETDYKEAYNNWCNDEEVCKYTTWNVHKNMEETRNLHENWMKEYNDNTTYRWIVELKNNHRLIGTIDIVNKKYIDVGAVEIGYCYGREFWGNGYASEAFERVIEYLFEECDMNVIFAMHYENNPASGKVMTKCGLKYEGRLKNRMKDKEGRISDIISYSITKEDYMKRGNKNE